MSKFEIVWCTVLIYWLIMALPFMRKYRFTTIAYESFRRARKFRMQSLEIQLDKLSVEYEMWYLKSIAQGWIVEQCFFCSKDITGVSCDCLEYQELKARAEAVYKGDITDLDT